MMLKGASPLIKKQLIAFGFAALVGMVGLAMTFLRVPETLGIGRYDMTVEFAQGAGLYKGAEVTYLGHPVGKVTGMEVDGDLVIATLRMRSDEEVPSDVTAEIHSRSAVGEQYVGLVPSGAKADAAALQEGDRIGVKRTSYPVEIGPVLDNVQALVKTIDEKSLQTVLEETSAGLDGRAGDLQTILDTGASFIEKADENFEPTADLINDSESLLNTINTHSSQISRLVTNLDQVTAELKAGDSDLETLLTAGPEFGTVTSSFLDDLNLVLPGLLGHANTIASVLGRYNANLGQLLTDYPLAVATVQSVTLPYSEDNAVGLTVGNAADPPECIKGFVPVADWSSPFDATPRKTPLVYCKESHDDPRAVRGARNVPCPQNPARRTGDATEC